MQYVFSLERILNKVHGLHASNKIKYSIYSFFIIVIEFFIYV
jgi:hypothetical protein